jgi:hypothetical protein
MANAGESTLDGGTDAARTVNERLPPVVIQRIVRESFRRFRLCYERGLKNNPNLQGRVTIKFIIDLDGTVKMVAKDPRSDMPDPDVTDCVVQGFSKLLFPPPAQGMVTVIYPIQFSPADDDGAAEAGAK